MNNTKYNEDNFLKVYNYFIENADINTFKNNYKTYFNNFLRDFFNFYNNGDYIILEDEKEIVKIHNQQLSIVFKNNLNNLYASIAIQYDINCFLTLKINLQNDFDNLYVSNVFAENDFYENMINYINHKSIELEKEELNYSFLVKENEIKLKELKYKRDLDLYRVNSGNFTDYELSTMYTEQEINSLRNRL